MSSRGSSNTCKGAAGVSIFLRMERLWVACLLKGAEILYSVSLSEEKNYKAIGCTILSNPAELLFEGFLTVIKNQPQKGPAKRAVAAEFCG